MKWLLVFLVVLAAVATGIKACSNSLFVQGHPHSHVKPTSPETAKDIGSFIAEYEPSIQAIEVGGRAYKISKAWAKYRTKLSYSLIWIPIYPRTRGVYVIIELEDNIAVDDQTLKNFPFWLNLESAECTHLSRNQFIGMSDGEPKKNYTFEVTNRLSKDVITRVELKKK